jgi:quinol monooxygenase YgiN
VTSLTLIATFEARAETREELERRLQEMVVWTTGEQGCVRYDLHIDADEGHRFVFIETWADQAAWEKHMTTDHVSRLLADVPALTTGGVKLEKLRQI